MKRSITTTACISNKLHLKSQVYGSSISHSKCSQLVCLPGLLQGSEFNILLVSLHRRLALIWSQGNYVNHRVVFLFVLSSTCCVITNEARHDHSGNHSLLSTYSGYKIGFYTFKAKKCFLVKYNDSVRVLLHATELLLRCV